MKRINELFRTNISEEIRNLIFFISGHKCRYCGIQLNIANGQVDHAIPLARNGSSDISNLRASCAQCNEEKGDKTESEYIALKRKQNAAATLLASILGEK